MPKVLILDDSGLSLRTTARFLKSRGLDVVTANTAASFADLLKDESPDLALIDVKMPGKTGDEIVRDARRDLGDRCCPLVLWSSIPTKDLEDLAHASGAAGSIAKSEAPDEFETQVRQFLR